MMVKRPPKSDGKVMVTLMVIAVLRVEITIKFTITTITPMPSKNYHQTYHHLALKTRLLPACIFPVALHP